MVITDTLLLGQTIKERRKEMGITQLYLSQATGLSTTFISDVENGKVTAEIGKVLKLVNILGMDLKVERRG
jgi:HTH-type transcriptional regulator / antitoxin HipB